MLNEKEKLKVLNKLGMDLNQVSDLDILLEKVLSEARRFVNADAGSIYLKEEPDILKFSFTQNDTFQSKLKKDEKLIYSTFKLPINTKSIAGNVAITGEFLNIPDVYELDENLPYKFSKKYDIQTGYQTHSMLTIPLNNTRGFLLGVIQIINARDSARNNIPFTVEDEEVMFHFASIASVALERAQMMRTMILRMIKMAELRDPKETGTHVNRVGGFSLELYEGWARKHNISEHEIDHNKDILKMGAMLHDVGKVAISDLILKKPARFSDDEYEIMKQHTVLGAQLFSSTQSDFDDSAKQIALNHHERWDGKGYPGISDTDDCQSSKSRGKKETEIPLYGRIVALADVYDALSSKRVYKEAWNEEDVLAEIRKGRGTQFDPELVDIFFERLNNLKAIQQRYLDE